jgi:2'-hydroxyisoflavone reductase
MKILIIGGTIFLGRHVVEAALSRGHEVTLFNRGVHDDGSFPEVEKLRGDRKEDLSALSGRRWDAVVDTCGYIPGVVRASARLLADAVEHYTFISSQSVYADYNEPNIDESYAVSQLTDEQVREAEAIKPSSATTAVSYGEMYGGLKALCERAVEEEMNGRALNVRAGLIVGPHDYSDRFTYWVQRIGQGGEVLAPGNANQPVQLVDVRDLSEWIVRMAEQRQAGVFNATGPDYKMMLGETLEACRSASGSDAKLTWVSEEFIAEEKIEGWSELPLWNPTDANIGNFFSIDSSKAINAGLSFRPVTETARATLEWDSARDSDVELKAGIKPEREKELLEKWHQR